MRILYECDLAGSRYHGMAYRIYQFSKEFMERGHQVMVVAASYSHVRHTNPVVKRNMAEEKIDGIIYKWIKTPSYKGNGAGRIFHMLYYNFELWRCAKKIARDFRPDIIISSGVTPLDFRGCYRMAEYAGAPVLLEVGDLWPLTPIELGGFSPRHPFIRFMQYAENYAYSHADGVISLLPCAREYMESHGLGPGKFNFIPNGVILKDWEKYEALPAIYADKISELKKQGKFLVGFTGTHSISNALDILLDVADRLKNTNIYFLLTGEGPVKKQLQTVASDKKITNMTFLPGIQKKYIPALLEEMDVLYIGSKRQSLYRFGISPNKIFDYMMAAKPIVQAIDAGNNLVKEANCGMYAEPGDVSGIADALLRIQNMSLGQRISLGENGRMYVMRNHSYNILTDRFLDLLERLTQKD